MSSVGRFTGDGQDGFLTAENLVVSLSVTVQAIKECGLCQHQYVRGCERDVSV